MLARWIATEPKMLILDEPTRGIDVAAKLEIMDLVKEQCRGWRFFSFRRRCRKSCASATRSPCCATAGVGEILGDDADEQKVFRMIAGVES